MGNDDYLKALAISKESELILIERNKLRIKLLAEENELSEKIVNNIDTLIEMHK
jgi:hypothetical protein